MNYREKIIPKIVFRYSGTYNKLIQKNEKDYPSEEEINKYLKEIKNLWQEKEEKILREISEITELEWSWNKISCYIVGKGRNFAFPLTITLWSEKTDFIDVLTHELIHRFEHQHQKHREKWVNYLNENFPKEKTQTKSHLLLFAIHKKIYLEIFDKKRFERNLQRNEDIPYYKRAWEIVNKEGYEEIINKFKRVTEKLK